MPRVHIAVGHGRRPNGTFDPGAVASDGTREYDANRMVAARVARLLSSWGVDAVTESDAGRTMDPNFSGTVDHINAADYDFVVSIHFDWDRAPRGGFGLYVSSGGREAAQVIARQWRAAGLPARPNAYRDDLSYLRRTNPTAVLWECDRIGADVTEPGHLDKMAWALAAGVAEYLGVEAPVEPTTVAFLEGVPLDEGMARVLAAGLGLPVVHLSEVEGPTFAVGRAGAPGITLPAGSVRMAGSDRHGTAFAVASHIQEAGQA